MPFADNARKGATARAPMNACRRPESFGNAQSTVVKDFGAFKGFPVAALLRNMDARACPISRQMPLAWKRENALYYF